MSELDAIGMSVTAVATASRCVTHGDSTFSGAISEVCSLTLRVTSKSSLVSSPETTYSNSVLGSNTSNFVANDSNTEDEFGRASSVPVIICSFSSSVATFPKTSFSINSSTAITEWSLSNSEAAWWPVSSREDGFSASVSTTLLSCINDSPASGNTLLTSSSSSSAEASTVFAPTLSRINTSSSVPSNGLLT